MSEQENAEKVQGKVKWFSDQKGYGFIAREDAPDVFVHHTAIQMEGFRTLRQGEDVVYELKDGVKGPQASKVTRPEGNGWSDTQENEHATEENASIE